MRIPPAARAIPVSTAPVITRPQPSSLLPGSRPRSTTTRPPTSTRQATSVANVPPPAHRRDVGDLRRGLHAARGERGLRARPGRPPIRPRPSPSAAATRSGPSPSSARSTAGRRASAPAPARATATRPASPLAVGSYTFRVQATDAAGNSAVGDPRVLRRRRRSLRRPQRPDTTITKGPKKTRKTRPKFKFTSSDPAARFQCKLDKGKFARLRLALQDAQAASGQAQAAGEGGRRRRDRPHPGGPEVPDPPAGLRKSGRPDLNRGPHRPERCALPGCATPRERQG